MSTALTTVPRPHAGVRRSGHTSPEPVIDSGSREEGQRDGRLLSVAELQQALREVRARRPAGGDNGQRPSRGGALIRFEVGTDPAQTARLSPDWVTVLAAHSGAGASTVALALSDAAAAAGQRVHLVEIATPSRSGLVGASSAELGADSAGRWRRGTRSLVTIDRSAEETGTGDWLCPSTGETAAVTVLDFGLPGATQLADVVAAGTRTVLVCRVSLPGVRLTEQVLGRLGAASVVVAAVGPPRWPGAVTSSLGSRLRALRAAGRVVPVPIDGRLQLTGLTSSPLPKPVLAAGRALLALLEVDSPQADGLAASPRSETGAHR